MSTEAALVRPRRPEDRAAVEALLTRCGLPADGLDRTEGWVLDGPSSLYGHVALERAGDTVVLRSLAVDPGRRGEGLGRLLFDQAERSAGPSLKVLRTDTIGAWVLRRGYRRAALGDLPDAVRTTTQFAGGLCATTPVYVKED